MYRNNETFKSEDQSNITNFVTCYNTYESYDTLFDRVHGSIVYQTFRVVFQKQNNHVLHSKEFKILLNAEISRNVQPGKWFSDYIERELGRRNFTNVPKI